MGTNWLLIFNMITVGKLLAILRHIWYAVTPPFRCPYHPLIICLLNISCMPNVEQTVREYNASGFGLRAGVLNRKSWNCAQLCGRSTPKVANGNWKVTRSNLWCTQAKLAKFRKTKQLMKVESHVFSNFIRHLEISVRATHTVQVRNQFNLFSRTAEWRTLRQ